MKIFSLALVTVFLCALAARSQTDVESFLTSAKRFEYYKRYDEAIAEINKAIEAGADEPDLYLKRAAVYSRLKNDAAVLADVQTAISFKPDDEMLQEEGARQLYLSGQYEEAIKIGERLIAANVKSCVGYRIRYRNRFQLKNYVGAIEDILKSCDVMFAHSEKILSKTLDELKGDPRIFTYYDELFKFLEQLEYSPSTMASLIADQSLKITLFAHYAMLYEERESSAAAALFDRYASELGLENRADVYREMRRFDAAIEDLSKVLEYTKNKSYYLVKRGDLYVLANQPDKAIADYKSAKAIDKDLNPQILDEKIEAAKKKILENLNQPR